MTTKQILLLAGAVLALAAPASAQSLSNLAVKVGASYISPDESASISTIGGDVDISGEAVPTLQLEYFVTPRISVELLCCMAQHDVKAVGTTLGTVDLGKVSHFPPTLTVKYRWNETGNVQPYVGAGVNYTRFFNEELPSGGPVTAIHYGDSWGGALQAGVDYKLGEHWFLNADVRKIWISSDVQIYAGATRIDASVDVNPWVMTVATGYRF